MNEWYYSNADPADATQEVRNGGARLPVWDAQQGIADVTDGVGPWEGSFWGITP